MENEKRDLRADGCSQAAKIKTHFAKIIVEGTAEKPYYEIMYFDNTDGQYHIGFGSFSIEFVFKWLSEEFEIVDAPTVDAVEVVRCRECKHCDPETYHCDHHMGTVAPLRRKPDDFCSYGERKDGAD